MFVDSWHKNLDVMLMRVNQLRQQARVAGNNQLVEEVLECLFGASCRLASYGTLQPGQCNHHWLDGVEGQWQRGWVLGHVAEVAGYPVLHLDPDGDRVPVGLFTSDGLAAHWDHLDRLEGANYRRSLAAVHGEDGTLAVATIYDSSSA